MRRLGKISIIFYDRLEERFIVNFFDIRGKNCVVYFLFKYIDSGIMLDNKKYNPKLPHIYVMTKWMGSNYFLS